MERKGIALLGNILTDNVKTIGTYPQKGMLVTIEEESLAVGGCVPNTGIDIKKLDGDMDVYAYGRVGKDYKGEYVVNKMKEVGLDVNGIIVSQTAPTSYSDVMTVIGTGERTFFHNRGANKEFCPEDIDIDKLTCKILHIGYIMLLDKFDKLNEDGTTAMSKFLEKVRSKGIKTSIDLVSESSGNFNKVVKATLPHCDYVIINEIEAGSIVGINPRDAKGELIYENVKEIASKLLELGVNEKVVIHCPEMGCALDKQGNYTLVKSRKLEKGFIKGSVGAGDAFCAGSLYSIYQGYDDQKMLEFSNLVAINCLSQVDSISGVCHKDRLLDVFNK
jgi:sugar/nucleoside kinase (ribokinase family)